ncbi:hypothetical protein L226DRAFT_540148 [Lentinus tigrinus ALCF2SS1-7]|uniref:Uncharacterized protein n=1 Tax=Lentinus tigrinus ALCF2SS1-6 TaxID=1328759 RepID=A0A5C2S2U8_9APHY|nr:hypothetical protein L227DRAFT_577581 [Lentinus tigrinus ALCF2SS1-6]RPD68976.1 hypothetical protein L226DRAFT_540148 [Lentinus tigrinus ALCF2SS1-7]
MIIPASNRSTMQDAPPSYDDLESLALPPSRDEKASSESTRSTDLLLLSPQHPIPSTSSSPGPSNLQAYQTWLLSLLLNPSAWTASQAAQEVRKTLVNLVQGLVRGGDPNGVLAILDSCADACRSYDLSLSTILQERSAAGHTPLYWAIVNRANPSPSAQDITYLRAMLVYAAPLSTATIDDVRLACLHSPNNTLFQCLRRIPAFSPLSPQERLILNSNVPVDEVDMRDTDANTMSFSVDFKIPMFQKRIRIAEAVDLEFIAKGRMWQLSFVVARKHDHTRLGYLEVTPGRLAVKLALLPHSPPTRLNATLVIKARTEDELVSSSPAAASDKPSGSSLFSPSDPAPSPAGQVNPPIEVRLASKRQLIPASGSHGQNGMVAVSLEENDRANTLQVDGCPYVGKDDTLFVSLNVQLDPTS